MEMSSHSSTIAKSLITVGSFIRAQSGGSIARAFRESRILYISCPRYVYNIIIIMRVLIQ